MTVTIDTGKRIDPEPAASRRLLHTHVPQPCSNVCKLDYPRTLLDNAMFNKYAVQTRLGLQGTAIYPDRGGASDGGGAVNWPAKMMISPMFCD